MRFEPERRCTLNKPRLGRLADSCLRSVVVHSYHDNRGLDLAREILLPVLDAHPNIGYSDLWILAGYEAVEALGGPRIEMSWGRIDATADQVGTLLHVHRVNAPGLYEGRCE